MRAISRQRVVCEGNNEREKEKFLPHFLLCLQGGRQGGRQREEVKEREKEGGRERELSPTGFTLQMFTKADADEAKPEARNSVQSPVWVTRTQVLVHRLLPPRICIFRNLE